MVVSVVTTHSAAAGGAKPAPVSSAEGAFAALLEKITTPASQTVEQKKNAIMLERIQQVGIAAYAKEQAQIEKMMKILRFKTEYADDDMKDKLGGVIKHFEQNPPETVDDIVDYLHQVERAIPLDAPRNMKQRMKDMIDEIMRLMHLPEADLAKVMAEAKKPLPGMGDAS